MFKVYKKNKDMFIKHSCYRTVPTVSNRLNEITMDFKKISGPTCYPIVGTLYKYWPFFGDYKAEALDKIAWRNWRKYGELVREEPGVNVLHVYDPDLIEKVFRQKEQYPERRSHVAMQHYRRGKPLTYNTGGLLSTNGPDWWKLRSTFQKNFSSPQNAKQYIEKADDILKEFIYWIHNISETEDFLYYLNRLFLEIIGGIAFNEHFQSFSLAEQSPESRSSRVIEAAFESNSGVFKLDMGIAWRFFKTPLYNKLIRSQEYLEKVSLEILQSKVNFFEMDEVSDKSLLRSFLQSPNVDLKDVTGMMVDILMAAIDTTSYATSFALYHLSTNEHCQELLFNELYSLLPTKDAQINSDIISRAVYLKSCIKESLRLNPVAIGVGRVLQSDLILKGYLIPKGTVIVTQNMVASRLPQYVREPARYKPERWMRDSIEYENIHPFLSLPFGFGSRSCIARRLAEQNMCITLIRLLREYKVEWRGKELGVKTFLINKPDRKLTFSFSRRKI